MGKAVAGDCREIEARRKQAFVLASGEQERRMNVKTI
jgi:hypothetical protein